ncbi:MAG: hypothetical protein ABSC94_10765 [Polyangiaceae bacterium]|jgi:hypothetical protein
MRIRDIGRLLSMLVLVFVVGVAAASCGTNNESVFHDAGTVTDSPNYVFGGDSSLGDASFAQCSARSCADWGYTCGLNADGCGNQINCGTCTPPDFCGGGGYSKCGQMAPLGSDSGTTTLPDGATVPPCIPQTCEENGYNCGWASDGCGGVVLCGIDADGGAITLASSDDAGVEAGAGGCPPPEFCGASAPNQCGGNVTQLSDGATISQCIPKTCPAGANCGVTGDSCGNMITCGGSCTNPQYCGGGGPNVCGGFNDLGVDGGAIPLCVPTTCQALGFNCGPAGDGCGGVLQCGSSCPSPEYCGAEGKPSVCGGNVNVAPDGATVMLCKPTTCAAQNIFCGQADDGCGNVLQCGTCTAPETCGGGGTPGTCGCLGLCEYEAACDGGNVTTITGSVHAAVSKWLNPMAPAQVPYPPDPVPNVLVYIPNGPLSAIPQGYVEGQCPLCGADVSGPPLVSTYTNYDGTFTLQNVPTPPASTQTQIPIVIQLGRWQKEFLIDTPPACQTTAIGTLNLPANKTDGVPAAQTGGVETTNIPLTAISTGNVDALECVLLKMGLDQAEFTANTGTGRIHVYAGIPAGTAAPPAGAPGATVNGANPEQTLMNGTNGTYMNYDQLMFPCWGSPVTKTADELASLVTYANSGGHFFSTHYSYSWLVNNGEFNEVASWNPNADNPGNGPWTLDVSTAVPVVPAPENSGIFYKWLNYVCALSNPSGACNPYNANAPPAMPLVSIDNPRFDANSVGAGSLAWITGVDQGGAPTNGDPLVEHFTFNTPVGAAQQCGHAIFSDFHVTNVGNSQGVTFPQECLVNGKPAPLSAQERILEYMIFDLASCVTPPASACTPLTCAQQGLQCGETGDGCGNPLNCGTCVSPLTCGGGGVRGVCGEPDGGICSPLSCTAQGIQCGPAGDGCGNEIMCPPCPAGQTCGGGGVPGHCGVPDAGMCVPETCAAQGIACGPAGDGCGNLIPGGCGTCPVGETCGGAGVPGQCGTPDAALCVPETCKAQNINCGPAGDGCGNLITGGCGVCTPPQTCGGGGVPGQCGGGQCVGYTCKDLGFDCGPAGDGCGGLLQCGTCLAGEVCGATQPGQCGSNMPK